VTPNCADLLDATVPRPTEHMPCPTTTLRNAITLAALGASLCCGASCRADGATEPVLPTLPAPSAATDTELQPTPPIQQRFSSRSRAGTYLITWESIGGPIPLNELFELDVTLMLAGDAPVPVTGAQVYVQASMPQHNHGMLREPQSREVQPGRYRVEGMLLHMTGYWQISLDVVKNGIAESTDFEVTLE
jgi:hypothetical protein